MKPEDLYERLERIFELDEIIRYKHENEPPRTEVRGI